MPFQAPIITTAGLAAINEVLAGGHTLAIVSTEFGSGFPATGDVPANFTGLKIPQTPGTNTSANDLTLYQTSIRTQVSSANISTAFQINEIGVYATLDAGAAFLYAYMTTGAATGDTLTPSSPSNAVIKAYAIVIAYTENVPVSTTITLDEVIQLHASTHLADGVDPIPPATPTDSGIVPKTNNNPTQVLTGGTTGAWGAVPVAAAGNAGGGPVTPNDPTQVLVASSPAVWAPVPLVTHTNKGGLPITPLAANYRPLTAADGTVSWQPTQPTLIVSTILYVKAGNPDIVPNFSTLQNALAYLGQYIFAPGISVLINVFGGIYANSSPINISHVNGAQITIQGVNSAGNLDADVTFTGVGSISGTAGNWSVQLTGCSNTAAVQVGNYIIVYNTGTSSTLANALVCGFFKVLAVTASTVTVQIPWHESSWPSMAGFTGGSFTPINAIFTATGSAQTGFYIDQHGLAAIRNIGLVATGPQPNNYSYAGFIIGGSVSFNRVGVSGFSNNLAENYGFGVNSAVCSFLNCAASGNSAGLISANFGNAICYNCAFTHNGILGVGAEGGTVIGMHGVTFVAGNSFLYQGSAYLVSSKGRLVNLGDVNAGNYWAGSFWAVYNAYQGLIVQSQSQYEGGSTDAFYSQFNGRLGVAGTVYDVEVYTQSYVANAGVLGSRIFNVPVGTLSADGSIII